MSTQILKSFNVLVRESTGLADKALEEPGQMSAFLGISITHRYFSRSTMEYFFQWGSNQFKEMLIVLMDDPDQFNFEVFQNFSLDQALEKARTIGDERRRSYEKTLAKHSIQNVRVIQFRDFIHEQAYRKVLKTIEDDVEQNSALRLSLEDLMFGGIGGKIEETSTLQNWSEPQRIRNLRKLRNYIVQELACLVYLTENGYPIEIDPTKEFSTKAELYDGCYPELAARLAITARGHIFAHPEGRLKNSY